MEELAADSGDAFDLRFSGYDFVSESPGREIFPSEHLRGADGGKDSGSGIKQGPVRIVDPKSIRQDYPWLSDTISSCGHRVKSRDLEKRIK